VLEPAAVVRALRLTKSFGGAAALRDVSVDLFPGEIHAIMGMNGAGKSTQVRILSGDQPGLTFEDAIAVDTLAVRLAANRTTSGSGSAPPCAPPVRVGEGPRLRVAPATSGSRRMLKEAQRDRLHRAAHGRAARRPRGRGPEGHAQGGTA